MKALFVHSGPLLYTKVFLRLEPLGLELVAEATRRAGHAVKLIDLQVEDHDDYHRLIAQWRRSGEAKVASQDHIRNPVEWAWDQIWLAALTVGSLGRSLGGSQESQEASPPAVCRIKAADLRDVLVRGLDDFGAYRTDVIFLCLIYPLVGMALAWLTFGYEILPLLFPLASGFALVGPVAAVGLYEMSRRREQGLHITWIDAFGVISSPGFGAILVLGLVLLAIFVLWLLAAYVIYQVTLGPEPPVSIAAFARDVFTTSAGWAMIVVGAGVGFLFAFLVLEAGMTSRDIREKNSSKRRPTSTKKIATKPTLWTTDPKEGLTGLRW